MKKCSLIILTGMLLTMMLGAPAMAATGISMDGKTYVFSGDQSTYEANGKTFIIGEDSVRIQEAGKPDRVLPMVESADSAGVLLEDTTASSAEATASEAGSVSGTKEAVVVSASEASSVINSTSALQSDRFSQYAKFGLGYDTAGGILYYQGQRVRVFEDSYSLGDNVSSLIEYFDEQDVVDVEAQRYLSADNRNADGSYDPSGLLTRLRALSAEEFARRDLTQWTQPGVSYTATSASSEGFMTAEEKRAFYAPYAEFGLTYDAKTDSLIYQGQVVRRFLDIRKSNGEALDSGRFSGTITNLNNDSGTIDVTTIRDYTRPDAEGNGKLVGVRVENAE